MNEINEIPKVKSDNHELPKVHEKKAEFSSIKDVWNGFVDSIQDFKDSVTDWFVTNPEFVEARDYGISESVDVAKECFPPEIIQEWCNMSLELRDKVIQEYSRGLSDALGIDFKGLIWEEFPSDDGKYTCGYNSGDGYIHLNVDLLSDPAMLMISVDTVAHELRHELQFEAISDPARFPFDDATISEWITGAILYTEDFPTAYDPWGYMYNPMEVDAKYFGETMVREITKNLINQE